MLCSELLQVKTRWAALLFFHHWTQKCHMNGVCPRNRYHPLLWDVMDVQGCFRWTCSQGWDFRESVADSPLGFLSGLKFYFPNTTQLNLQLTNPSPVYNLLTFNFACTFPPCLFCCATTRCFISGKLKPDVGKTNQSSKILSVPANGRHRSRISELCSYTSKD